MSSGTARQEGAHRRGLAGTGWAGEQQRGGNLGQGPEERGGLLGERAACDQGAQRLVGDGVLPHGHRQPVRHRRDDGGEPCPAVEHPRLLDGRRGVEPPVGAGQQPVDELPILGRRGRLHQRLEPAVGPDVRDPVALDEDLLDVGRLDQLGHRPESGDRLPQPLHHALGIPQRHGVAGVGGSLVVGDGGSGDLPDGVGVGGRAQLALLDRLGDATAELVVDAQRLSSATETSSGPVGIAVATATDPTNPARERSRRTKPPRRTTSPCHDALRTLLSVGRNVSVAGRQRALQFGRQLAMDEAARRRLVDDDVDRHAGEGPDVADQSDQPGGADRAGARHGTSRSAIATRRRPTSWRPTVPAKLDRSSRPRLTFTTTDGEAPGQLTDQVGGLGLGQSRPLPRIGDAGDRGEAVGRGRRRRRRARHAVGGARWR